MLEEVRECSSQLDFCRQVAELIVAAGRDALEKRGRFTLVLTGGGTVQALYHHLAASDSRSAIKKILAETYFFLGDERFVPVGHPDNNGAMAWNLLLEPAGVAGSRFFRIRTDLGSAAAGATDYEKTLRGFFANKPDEVMPLPEFDLVLLGLGSDGHVASLFPGTDALFESERWVTTSFPPELAPAVARITMTMPLLNQAGEVIMLVSGSGKKATVRQILTEPERAAKLYPAALVRPGRRKVWLLVDD